jgi:LmbE family N-acetylglucosaminyl deacetylase
MDEPPNRFVLASAIRRFQPNILLTIAGRTPAASPDHHQGHMLAEASRFYSQLTKWNDRFENREPYRVPHLVYALMPFDAEERHWRSKLVIDISDTIETKLESVRCYQSQFDSARFAKVEHWLRGINAYYGGLCGFAYGEMFALPHPVGASDLVSLVQGNMGSPAPVELPGQSHLPMG